MSDLETMCERPVLILGTLMTAGAMLTGCGVAQDEPPVNLNVYKDVEMCTADGYSASDCKAAFDQAQSKLTELAPRYTFEQDCEDDYGAGKCEVAPVVTSGVTEPAASATQSGGGHSTFIYPHSYYRPYSSGFAYSGSGAHAYSAQPVFSNLAGMPHLANGQPVNFGKSAVPAHVANPQTAAKFAPGQSVAKGTAPVGHAANPGTHATAGKPGGTSGARSSSFGSTGRGFSGGG